jgi:membrane protease YdiL (CAAX protease family)
MEQPAMIRQGWLRALIFVIAFTVVLILLARFALPFLESALASAKTGQEEQPAANQLYLYSGLLVSSLVTYLLVLLFRRIADRKTVDSLGLGWRGYAAHAVTGFFLGPVLIGIGTLLLIAVKSLEWIDISTDATGIFLTLGMMVIIAFAEELAFRGYILNNLMESMNKWIALLISAVVFSLFHSNNPAIGIIPLANLFLGGLLLGINYIYTRNLWFGILFHFTWNFYQGGLLGYDVSGLPLESFLQHERTGNDWLSGGAFGFEGSVACTFLTIVATILLAWIYERKLAIAVDR